jgi:LPS-assembly protein
VLAALVFACKGIVALMLLPDFHRQMRGLLGFALGFLANSHMAHAQRVDAPPLALRSSSLLEENISGDTRKKLPSFMESDSLSGRTDLQTVLEGQVVIRRGDLILKADKVDYDQADDFAKARGHVYINRSGNVYQGPALDLHMDAFEGFFTNPNYQLVKNKAHGQASHIDFIDPSNTVLHNADFTTCQRKPGPSWTPDWFFKAETITLDTDRNVGKADGASLRFKGVPILPVPSVDFPLSDERKSGLLPPSIGVDNIGGLEYTQPYYVNLAPNRDVTFTPTYWSKRGMRLGTEFRYMESAAPQPPFQGEMHFDYMEKDILRDGARRWRVQLAHTGLLNPAFAGGGLGLGLNLNKVSDDDYWKDFPLVNNTGVQRLLSNDGSLSWAKGTFTSSVTVQRWTTLQDLANSANYITPPFNRLPQVNAQYQKFNLNGFDLLLSGQLTRFESARQLECQAAADTNYNNCAPNANRVVSAVAVSRPFVTPYGYITPKLQASGRTYQFDGGLPSIGFYGGHQSQTTATVTVPTFSVDAGVSFERDSHLFGRAWTQTFEPRAFYVFTPFREQNYLPNYDSGGNAFNFASIFTENAFGGYDRIADSKLLTLGATTRFIDPETGAEGARFGLAQRLRMQEQLVTLPGDPTAKTGVSDLLAGATVQMSPRWALDTTVQYNQKTSNYLRRIVSARYSPGSYRVLNMGYRTQNDELGVAASRQVDLGWQWPLHDLWRGEDANLGEGRGLGEGRWYSVARVNYNPLDKKIVESVYGFEYDAGCWLGRVVSERLQVADSVARQRLLFQLEFVGFSKVGTNALGSLRNNVSRYQPLRLPAATPSRFGNYD